MINPTLAGHVAARKQYNCGVIHTDPKIRASRAAAAFDVLRDPNATRPQVRNACHVVLINAADTRRDTACQILGQLTASDTPDN